MFFSLVNCDDKIYQEAKTFFLQWGRSDLLYKSRESLIWAYMITKYMHENRKIWFDFQEWIYSYEDLFFSTSHKNDTLVIIIDSNKVAVDLEFILPRDESLLNWITILSEDFSKRENFYIQRCAKECLIKYLDLNIEEMQNINIWKIVENQNFMVDWCNFEYSLKLNLVSENYSVFVCKLDDKIITLIK